MKNSKAVIVFGMLFVLGTAVSLLLYSFGNRTTARNNGSTANHTKLKTFYPRRIVCMTPSITEVVFALGCGERVVGIAGFSNYPAEAMKKPTVGAFVNPNFEQLVKLSPDLVIVQGKAEKLQQFCEQSGIRLLRVKMYDLATIYRSIDTIGKTLGCHEQADRLCWEIRIGLAKVEHAVRSLPRKRVFLCSFRSRESLSMLCTTGSKTYLAELLSIAGGDNVFADLNQDYPQISKESLLKRNPQLIIEPHPGEELSQKQLAQLRADWELLSNIEAVYRGDLTFPTEDYLLIPGPRMVLAAEKLAQLIHPEAFDKKCEKRGVQVTR